MTVEWNYTNLASAYLKRPDYADAAIAAMLSIANINPNATLCDVGAGAAHLTRCLAAYGYPVVAVEPNDAMRNQGIAQTRNMPQVRWCSGTGEETNQPNHAFDMVTFGSSFNVCNRALALKETSRILKPDGWFACLWNHRDLHDPIQKQIELIIKEHIQDYHYGTRREDQTNIINQSALFGPVLHLDSTIIHEQSVTECVEAWRSHATLARQAGASFDSVISDIEKYLLSLKQPSIYIPYSTNIWLAKKQ